MSTSLRIAEVAERVGVSTATVRYYERIGVLPQPNRSGNGYRVYDDRTVERLEFIGRAKQLGCNLDEITGLVTAWDGGECGPVQDRLRALVADKLEAATIEISELATLTDDLRSAAEALEQHRPVGRCDDRCGCITDAAAPTPEVAIAFTDPPTADVALIACTLDPEQIPSRLDDWNDLIGGGGASRYGIPGGIRIEFADDVDVAEVARLAAAEQHCCRFFSFRITIDGRGTALEATAPEAALEVLYELFGAPE
jgi:MerR family transcriptional regulator, copper efflux regulator